METPTDTRNCMVINREFDGRAIDPAQKNRSVFSYDKSHPPPAVVSLPTPASTKRVPQQIQNRSEAERPMKDINLQKEINGGPMLVKQPEKLRDNIPYQVKPFEAPQPRRVPPIYQAPHPRVSLPDKSPQPSPRGSDSRDVMETPTYTKNYMVINREFDGRAVDPVSGRLYEYNTRTNERRWVHTPDGHEVKLTRDED
ncbi:uncharacterized protein LOC127852828 [Dreissena polymorpha]|nr:uncharacterized protein LOC127852828 [Dreissena polymorpha]